MDALDPDKFPRTAKLEMDEGRASSPAEAVVIAGRYVLEVMAGVEVATSPTRQMMLLTVVNAGARAFRGGVRVQLELDAPTSVRWGYGRSLAQAVGYYGGTVVSTLDGGRPAIVIGAGSDRPDATVTIRPTWQAWSAGVVEFDHERLPEEIEFELAGVAAGAFAVSEAFQHVRGRADAGRRPVGISLWRPDLDWRGYDAYGPPVRLLPKSVWLLGLGHLGQAYAWALGALPYRDPDEVSVMLQDFDDVVEANADTGMLCGLDDRGLKKTRVLARELERLGFKTFITERRFDEHTKVTGDEPRLALAGFDDPAPRRLLEGAGFDLVVDAGLGGTKSSYLEIDIHTFPSALRARGTWPSERSQRQAAAPPAAYRELGDALRRSSDRDEGEIQCGLLRIVGQSVGAAFVGCAAATLVLAEPLRMLHGGSRYQVVSLSLRTPEYTAAVENEEPGPAVNSGFVPV